MKLLSVIITHTTSSIKLVSFKLYDIATNVSHNAVNNSYCTHKL